ncbi:MAG: hypothetical protein M3083_04465 [Actinomycetota bacterium]|nr:hypothetical protein [Actinomycetota bacterium]
MRLLFVVPGGGRRAVETAGWCGQFLSRLAGRGHVVEIVTTVGTVGEALVGPRYGTLTVHRLPVGDGDGTGLAALVGRCIEARFTPRLDLQEAWISGLGPTSPELVEWLWDRAGGFDAVGLIDGASALVQSGVTALAGIVPTVLHPLAADQAWLRLGVFDTTLRLPTAMGFVDGTEASLVHALAPGPATGAVVGCGVEQAPLGTLPDQAEARELAGLGDQPYLLAGRGSGAGRDQLVRYFSAYTRRHGGPLRLVVGGEELDLADQAHRMAAIGGAVAVVQPVGADPLPVLWAEAGASGRPCLMATGAPGRLRPRPGAFGFGDFFEFEAAVELLVADQEAGAALGFEGWRFVESNCRWDDLLARYERLLHVIQSHR